MRVFVAAKVGEAHRHHAVANIQQRQLKLDIFAVCPLFEIPFAFFAPAKADGAVRRHQFAVAVISHGFPFRVITFSETVKQVGSTQHTARRIAAVVARLEYHQHRHVGVGPAVVEKVIARVIEVEGFEDHMAHGHRQRAVGALLRRQPLVAELSDFRIVRRDGDSFGAFVAHFGKEVGVRGSGLRHVGAPGNNVAGVVPVGRFRHVGLFAPGHRRGGGQIAVPVIKAQAGAANQR